MKKTFFRIAISIMGALSVMIVALASCSTSEEPVMTSSESGPVITRSSGASHSLTEDEAISFAKESLGISVLQKGSYSLDYVIAKTMEHNNYGLSDTLAYVINVNNGKGFAVVVNDNRKYPVISYGLEGNVKVEDGVIDHFILKNVEKVVNKDFASYTKSNTVLKCGWDHEHYYIDNPIKTLIHEGDPFDRYVVKDHPGCKPGSVPTCSAILLSQTQKTFRYNGYLYNMPDLFNCLVKGPGSGLPDPGIGINSFGQDYDISFMATYDSAVSAFGNLIYDLGKNMRTDYSKVNSKTNPLNAYNVLANTTCTMSEYYSFDLNTSERDIWSLLYQGYYVMFMVDESEAGGQMTLMITGGENRYSGSDPAKAGTVAFNTYVAEENSVMVCCDPKFLDHLGEGKTFFGIKKNL